MCRLQHLDFASAEDICPAVAIIAMSCTITLLLVPAICHAKCRCRHLTGFFVCRRCLLLVQQTQRWSQSLTKIQTGSAIAHSFVQQQHFWLYCIHSMLPLERFCEKVIGQQQGRAKHSLQGSSIHILICMGCLQGFRAPRR